MKEKDARVNYNPHQLILYVEKKDGTYGPMQTGSYITKNYVDDYWQKRKNLEIEYMEKIKNGEASPIEFYMILEELSIAELASRVKISRGRVKKHCRAEHFGDIKLDELFRYAEIFDIPPVNMLQAVVTKKKNITVSQEKTKNPLFSLLKIEVGK